MEKPVKASEVEAKKLDETELNRQRLRQTANRVRARSAALKATGAIDNSGSSDLHAKLEARLDAVRRNVSNSSRAQQAVAAKLRGKDS